MIRRKFISTSIKIKQQENQWNSQLKKVRKEEESKPKDNKVKEY